MKAVIHPNAPKRLSGASEISHDLPRTRTRLEIDF